MNKRRSELSFFRMLPTSNYFISFRIFVTSISQNFRVLLKLQLFMIRKHILEQQKEKATFSQLGHWISEISSAFQRPSDLQLGIGTRNAELKAYFVLFLCEWYATNTSIPMRYEIAEINYETRRCSSILYFRLFFKTGSPEYVEY